MQIITRNRNRIGISVLIGFILLNSLRTLQQILLFNPNIVVSEHVAPLEAALDPLDEQLPDDTIIGYLGDPHMSAGEYTRLYYAMHYSLAPHIVRMVGPTPPDLYAQTTDAELAIVEQTPAIVVVYDADSTLHHITNQLGLTKVEQLNTTTAVFCRNDTLESVACPFSR